MQFVINLFDYQNSSKNIFFNDIKKYLQSSALPVAVHDADMERTTPNRIKWNFIVNCKQLRALNKTKQISTEN